MESAAVLQHAPARQKAGQKLPLPPPDSGPAKEQKQLFFNNKQPAERIPFSILVLPRK